MGKNNRGQPGGFGYFDQAKRNFFSNGKFVPGRSINREKQVGGMNQPKRAKKRYTK